MEERRKRKQEDRVKEDTEHKVGQQKTKVPVVPSSSSSSSSVDVSGAPCSQQCVTRLSSREVPPRFRLQEHKQLLRRGHELTLSPSTERTSHTGQHLSTVLSQKSGPRAQHENSFWGISATTRTSSSTFCDQGIVNDNSNDTSISSVHIQTTVECSSETESDSSNMSMATGASQHSHYPINKASINHSSNMVSSQGGPGRGWASEGKSDLSMGTSRAQSGWGSSNLNLNPSANPAAWPVLGHEGPGMGSGPGVMGGMSSLPSNMCGPGGVAPVHGVKGNGNVGCTNGNLVGDCAWGNPDTPDQHESPTGSMSFGMETANLKNDGPSAKVEPMSPVNSWRGSLSQSPSEQTGGDRTSLWGGVDAKSGDPKGSGWDSGASSWGKGGGGGGGGGTGWGEWSKHSSTEGTGWDANDGPTQEPMSSWGTDAPTSEGSRDSSSEGNSGQGRDRSSSMEFPLLPRQDLDPRVLCNTGWGQTPIRQHTVWEMDESSDLKDDGGTEAWGSSSSTSSSVSPPPSVGCGNPAINPPPPRMESGSSRAGPNPGWGGSGAQTGKPNTGWGEPNATKKVPNGSVGSWGEPMPDAPSTNGSSEQSWGSGEKSPSWEDGSNQGKPQGWGGGSGAPSGWRGSGSGNNSEWAEPPESRKSSAGSSSWDGDGGNWKDSQRGWGKAAPTNGGNWGDSQTPQNGPGWAGKAQKSHSSGGSSSMGSWGGPTSVKQSGSGWGSAGGRQDPGDEATGWEEPSPSSIRRKMDIDDGTSTWGDPKTYRSCVNMWDKNNPSSHSNPGNGGNNSNNHAGSNHNNNTTQHHPQHGQTHNHANSTRTGSPNRSGPPHNRMNVVNPGWGELPSVQSKPESSSWAESSSSSPPVDNGTSAWGKPPRGSGGWGATGHESSSPYARGGPPPAPGPCKPAPKSMQDGWGSGGEEMGVSGSQWDGEDGGDMWTSPASQDGGSSCSSWNQGRKGMAKGKMTNKQDEVWIMNRLIKQLTDMGFPRDPAEEALRSNNMNLDQAMSALLEKKSDGDKRGVLMSDYSSVMNKPVMCRPPNLSKDSALERSPFLDKDGSLSDDTVSSPFLPSPALKLPLSGVSPALAMQNMSNRQMSGVMGSSGAAAQARCVQQHQQHQAPPPQPSVPPLNSAQPNLRAQVPHFLSPQVQAQLLQFAAKNIGLNPALLTSPINPQQMTLLYQLQQLQMAYQRLQIQQQMMQAQRNVSGPIRQQEQQVARTISNMQQQIQQHQRQLAQALLIKQQQQQQHSPGPAPGLPKSGLDVFPGHAPAPGLALADLHAKEPQPAPASFSSSYGMAGMSGSVNGCMEVECLSMKESQPQPQSRLSQWTHTSAMESLSTSSSHLDSGLAKHGAPASTHMVDSKPMDDSFSTYSLLSSAQSPGSPMVESWTQGKSPNDKISNGTNVSWPPEFCPGVPWKGLQNIDPEADPNMTPGSVSSVPTINTNIQDVNRYLLRDRAGGKLLDMKSTWSSGPASNSLSHELWKVAPGGRSSVAPPRPPPGLTNAKPSPGWTAGALGLGQGWSGSYSNSNSSSEGTAWSSDSSPRSSSWLVLRNLTPQIDGSTLRTLCMQHGPLITFHLSLPQGNALVRYSSKEEAAKAQKSLHMCVLGNTTILAEFAGEEDVTRFFSQGQSLTPSGSSWQGNAAPGANVAPPPRLAGHASSNPPPSSSSSSNSSHPVGSGHWSGGGVSAGSKAGAVGELLWGGAAQYSGLWGAAGGAAGDETRVVGSPVPINTLLPGDLLTGDNL